MRGERRSRGAEGSGAWPGPVGLEPKIQWGRLDLIKVDPRIDRLVEIETDDLNLSEEQRKHPSPIIQCEVGTCTTDGKWVQSVIL